MSLFKERENREAPTASLEARLNTLHSAMRRTRSVLYVATIDGTITNTLWANATEELLNYLDRVLVATAPDGGMGPLHIATPVQPMRPPNAVPVPVPVRGRSTAAAVPKPRRPATKTR